MKHHLSRGTGFSAILATLLVTIGNGAFISGSFDMTPHWHIDTNMRPAARMMNDVLSGPVVGVHA